MDKNAGPSESSSEVPLHWQHRRYESYASANIVRPPAIILEDRTDQPLECTSPLWAKGVLVDSYVVVSGKMPSIGDYVVWNCKITTLDVSDLDPNLIWAMSNRYPLC